MEMEEACCEGRWRRPIAMDGGGLPAEGDEDARRRRAWRKLTVEGGGGWRATERRWRKLA